MQGIVKAYIFTSYLNPNKMEYKAHLFANIGNGKLHPSRMQCGRHLYRNSRGTHAVKTAYFRELYLESKENCCTKCAEWAKENGKI